MPESFFDDQSRVDKYNKRRKNTKLINTLIVLGGFLLLFFLFLIIFGDDEEPNSPDREVVAENDSTELNEDIETEDEASEEVDTTEPELEEENDEGLNEESSDAEEETSTDSENIEESNDPNVLETIVLDWDPIGTVQEEPHVATYDSSTQDWKEMWAAVRYATGLSEDDTIEWWVTNNGDENSAKLTISNKAQTDTYRVYIEWVTNEGWKPLKVEVLKENDIKEEHFSGNSETETQQEESEEQ